MAGNRKEQRLRELAGLLSARIDEVRKESRERACAKQTFQAFADTLPCVAWTATPDGEIDYFNRRWYEFFGGADLNWRERMHPDDRESSRRDWAHSLATGQPLHRTSRYCDAHGVYHHVVTRAHAVRCENGRILYWVGTSSVIVQSTEALQVA